jgi:hypothetical protein
VDPAVVVSLHLWEVPARRLPLVAPRLTVDRLRLRSTPGLRFARVLGTGAGRTFTPGDADPRRWGVLSVWDDATAADAFDTGPFVARWRRIADEQWVALLRPLSSRGRWAGAEPFGRPVPRAWQGQVAAVTRARLAPRAALRFWRAVPPVAADLHRAPGLVLALGIGEAPIGLQGTFSVWSSAAALNHFAYQRPAHVDAIARTAPEGWYAEELFARFGVLSVRGRFHGVDHTSGG